MAIKRRSYAFVPFIILATILPLFLLWNPFVTEKLFSQFSPSYNRSLSDTEIKYLLITSFSDIFYCDPDYYPIQRQDETKIALTKLPHLQANKSEFDSILTHLGYSYDNLTSEKILKIYREHKKLNSIYLVKKDNFYEFSLKKGKEGDEGYLINGTIAKNGVIQTSREEKAILTCPICLAGDTLISTPEGSVAIQDITPGVAVNSFDQEGNTIHAPVIKTVKRRAILHRMLDIKFVDGRKLITSPTHPTIDGRILGDLMAQEDYGGSKIFSIQSEIYKEIYTYDILPAGETGHYAANGIAVASSLK